MQLPTSKQRAYQRKLYRDIAETLHQARLARANWLERLILKHLARKHKLKQ